MEDRIPRSVNRPLRSRFIVVILFSLVFSPLLLGSVLKRVDLSEGPAVQISFTPHLTPLNLTFTPQPTVLQTLAPQASPPPEPVETPVPVLPISGGDATVGYDFVEGSGTPTWRVWFEGETITVKPKDAAATALLLAFLSEADKRATELNNKADAETTLWISTFTAGFGALSAAGGIIVAAPSCAGVPLTFWAAGGTGWPCAGGVAAAVGGVGALIISGIVGLQAFGDRAEANENIKDADREAKDLFEVLKGYASP